MLNSTNRSRWDGRTLTVGLCDSGGAGKVMVAEGVVSVDGQQELRKTAKIRAGAVVTLGDVQISVIAAA